MTTQNINCNEAKRIDIVTYLESLHIKPTKVTSDDYWYLSPLRKERTPSFKVNRKQNAWFDHGIGKGGNLIDLGILLHNCTVAEFLERLSSQGHQNTFSFHQQITKATEPLEKEKPKISIMAIRELQSTELKNYIEAVASLLRGLKFF